MTYQIVDHRENALITADNLQWYRDIVSFSDQAAELKPDEVMSTYCFLYENRQRGQLTVYHSSGRAAVALGGDSEWGDWDNDNQSLRLTHYDDTHVWRVDIGAGRIWKVADIEEDEA